MLKLYIRESNLEIMVRSLYQTLREKGVNLTLTDEISTTSDDLYMITGGQYLTNVPKNYIVIQTIPTSNLTLKSGIEAYWITKDYLDFLKNALYIWDISSENIKVWRTFYHFENVSHLDLGFSSHMRNKVTTLMNHSSINEVKHLIKLNNFS